MGAGAGRRVGRQLAWRRYDLVISTGFAGAAQPGFKPGDLVVATEVIDGSTGLKFIPQDGWAKLKGIRRGPFLTVQAILTEDFAKAEAGRRFNAMVVELETAWVARAALERGIPWMGLRAILDPMETTLEVSSWRKGMGLAIRPWCWGRFGQFLKQLQRVRTSLAGGLTEFTKGE